METEEDKIAFELFKRARAQIADVTGTMMHRGIPDLVCVAALGAVAGNLIGLNTDIEDHAKIIDDMRKPMLASAKEARELKDSIILRAGR